MDNQIDIKALRKQKNLSQQELADKIGVPRGRLNAWEQRGTVPKVQDYEKLAKIFKLETNVSKEQQSEITTAALSAMVRGLRHIVVEQQAKIFGVSYSEAGLKLIRKFTNV